MRFIGVLFVFLFTFNLRLVLGSIWILLGVYVVSMWVSFVIYLGFILVLFDFICFLMWLLFGF